MTNWAAVGLGLWGLMAGLTLVGCGTSEGEVGGSAGFVPVSRLQPTESGAWVVNPSDPLTLYALGVRSMRSSDGGHTWAELAWPADARSLSFARVPAPALYLQVGDATEADGAKLFKSLDGGDTWTKVGAGAGSAVLVDGDSRPVLVSYTDHRISRSTDDGATWVNSVLPDSSDLIPLSFGRAVVSTDARPIVYVEALGFNSDPAVGYQPLVMVSTDAGATFVVEPVPAGPGVASFFAPHLSLDCRGRLYVLVGNTVYRSGDAGITWQSVIALAADVTSFEVIPGVPAACSESVYAFGQRPDGAYLWHLDATGGVDSRALPDGGPVADLGDDRLLLASTYAPLRRRSDDGGRSWWTVGVNLADGNLAVSPAREGLLFVSTGGNVLRSDDAGHTWRGASNAGRGFVSSPYADPHDASVLYTRSIYGEDSPWSFVSTDGGASLQNWPVPTQDNPEIPQAIASSSTGRVTVVTQQGVYATDDAGQNFTPLKVLPAQQRILWAAIGASEPPSIYMYVSTSDFPANEILASVDGGVTWTSADPGMYATNLVAHPSDPQIAFALPSTGSTGPGPLRTLDGGETWSQLAAPGGEAIGVLRIAASPPYDLYALGQRLYRSSDEGDTWQLLGDAPPQSYDFQLDPHPGSARYVLGASGLLYEMVE